MEAAAVNMKRGSHAIRTRWGVWFAVLIAVYGALAPTVSHAIALAQSGTAGAIQICTPQGMQFITTDSAGYSAVSSDGPESVLSLSHCPFCLHTTDRVAPPPHLLPYLFLDQGRQQEVPDWQAFSFVNFTAFAPPPRGPPACV
jgi:D-alanyl-lipoteichoic acid acyltransferase DltB (MBOAT superfamily)